MYYNSIRCLLFLSVALLLSPVAHTQICTGSLGDPVVNISFGSGPNPGPSLPGATTTYGFISFDCPGDGFYTVINSSNNCFGGSWHSLTDHTPGDNDGYMMLVNASFTPGDFFVDTVKGLCSGTTYEFSAWIANVLRPTACSPNPIRPKLVFNIESTDGTVLGTYSTGDLIETATADWKQYGLFFTTPLNNNVVVIRITNSAPGGCGNDLALDDISFRPCGPEVKAAEATTSSPTVDFCIDNIQAADLSVTIGPGYTSPAIQWQTSTNSGASWTDIPGATNTHYIITVPGGGSYLYRAAVAEGTNIGLSKCRVASNIVTITVHNLPVPVLSSSSPVCEKNTLSLLAAGGSTYLWSGPAAFTSNEAAPAFAATMAAAGTYTAVVTDAFGCSSTAATIVVVNPAPIAGVNNDKNICTGGQAALLATGGGTYLWQPANGLSAIDIANPVAQPAESTVYSVIVTNNVGCTDTAVTTINVVEAPTANAGADKYIIKGQSIVLDGTATNANLYSWSPSLFLDNPSLLTPLASPAFDMVYTLTTSSDAGCGVATDQVKVKVFNDIYIPTAFTPNGDGVNDNWSIESLLAFPDATVSVYNRVGEKVFETSSGQHWDGTYKGQQVIAGAYVYYINFKNKRNPLKGFVTVIR
ncbi:MAG: hypothetical protein RL172_1736 [Bacteroidota bacterium]|jgi:gliding motility-associated-like protein